ncbi:DUF3558 family protein [Actinokineospora pegani]|uniref:DUF3558 family protein n=1 Tax=Actinokineospora pegani TaxID=2654637 RepID=UPI0018D3646F|nr:DUF3558 family protein [Actinokineospora pegani]
MKRAVLLSSIVGSLLLGAGACSNDTDGSPVPSPGGATSTSVDEPDSSSEPSTGQTSSGSGDGSLASLQPCDLLTDADQAEVGVSGSGTEKELAGSRYCDWRVREETASASYTLSVQIWEDLGLADVQGTGKQTTKVGSHEAVQALRTGGSACSISLGVGAKSRVDVVLTGADGAALCAPAATAAALVEPKLP